MTRGVHLLTMAAEVLDLPPDQATEAKRRRIAQLLRANWMLAAILALALVVRICVWWQFLGYQIGRDEVDYFRTAVELANTGRFIDPNPVWIRVPLFSVIAAGFFRLFGPDLAAVNLFQILLGVANAYLVYLFTEMTFNRRAGLAAAFMFAVFPPLVNYSSAAFMTEPLFAFLMSLLLVLAYLSVRRSSLWLAAGAGAVLGLACLTRPSAIAFAPLLAAWYFVYERHRLKLAGASVLVAAVLAVAVIAPWTARNYQAYGHFILLDTVGAYNLWRDNNYDRLDNPVHKLRTIENPADRQSYATRRGIENITGYPGQFLSSGVEKLNYLWHMEIDSYAKGDFWDLTGRGAGFLETLVTDLLLILVGVLAAIGLGRSVRLLGEDRGKPLALLLLWLVAAMGPAFIFHSEARFRIAFLPQLFTLAAVPLAGLAWPGHSRMDRAWKWLVTLAGLGWVLVGSYSPAIAPVVSAHYFILRGDLAATNDLTKAAGWYEEAIMALPGTPFGYSAAGDAFRRQGLHADAIAMYEKALAAMPGDSNAHLGLADSLDQMGSTVEAREHFEALNADETERQRYAWEHFQPSPRAYLDVGSGAEAGCIRGFHAPEYAAGSSYRWTRDSAAIRFQLPEREAPRRLVLGLAPWPPGLPSPFVSVTVNGTRLPGFEVAPNMSEVELSVPAGSVRPGRLLVMEITSGTFVPAHAIEGSSDQRELGIALDWVRLEDWVGAPD